VVSPISFINLLKSLRYAPLRVNRRFGEDGVEKKMGWVLGNCAPDHELPRSSGAGTGVACPSPFALHESGYVPPYLGCLDYSVDLVQLARAVAAWPRNNKDVTFYVCDFLEHPSHGQRFGLQG